MRTPSIALLILAGTLSAQTTTPTTTTTPVATTTTVTNPAPAAPTLPVSTPQDFAYGVTFGASYTQNSTPQAANGVIGTWLEIGTGSGTYWVNHLRINSTYSTVDTGVAKVFAKSGNFTLGGLLAAGISTATPTVGNFSGGGFGKYDLSGKLSGWSVVAEVGITAVTSTTAVVPNQVTPNVILSIGKFF